MVITDKEEILAKVRADNRACYVQMKVEDYRIFFEEIIEKEKTLTINTLS